MKLLIGIERDGDAAHVTMTATGGGKVERIMFTLSVASHVERIGFAGKVGGRIVKWLGGKTWHV